MSSVKLVNIGFGNLINAGRVIALISPDSAPVKRIASEAKQNGKLIDATYGRRTRAIAVMDNGDVVLCPIQPETIAARADYKKTAEED